MTKQRGVSKHGIWFHLKVHTEIYRSILTVSSLHILTFAVKQDSSAAYAVNQCIMPLCCYFPAIRL